MRRQTRRGKRKTTAETGVAPGLGGVLEFMRTIWGISHGLQSASKRMEARLGITGPQRLAVRILGRHPGASAGQLANILRLHPSTLTGILRRLEDRGVIVRSRVERDRRQASLRLTAAGRAIDRRHKGTVEAAIERVLADVPPETIESAARVLGALEAALTGRAGGRTS